MRCTAYCTAYAYKLKPLFESLRGRYVTTLYRDVIHVELHREEQFRDVFYFSFGAMVCWGTTKQEAEQAFQEVKSFQEHPLDQSEEDEFTINFDDKPRVFNDELTLPNKDLLSRLAVSHGLAQSVKLGAFEIAIQKTIDHAKIIPEDLASQGRIRLSKQEIRRKMGELFIERNSINLYFDILDTPEFFWEHAELEPLYTMTSNYLDIRDRARALNQKLDIVHELFDMLVTELNHQHSAKLELTIIWLICIEVGLSLLQHVFKVF